VASPYEKEIGGLASEETRNVVFLPNRTHYLRQIYTHTQRPLFVWVVVGSGAMYKGR
jgi:hypothetical protein